MPANPTRPPSRCATISTVTAPRKTLPVPPLTQTLDRYLEAVRPISTDAEFEATRQAVAAFAAGSGPACQTALEEYAAAQAEAGSSWLAPAWLESYLTTREPLPLVSNVGWLIHWPGEATGIARAADFLHRIAAVHLAYCRGELPPEVTGRGEEVDPAQRAYLAGGIRDPRPDLDGIDPGPTSPAGRTMVVWWRKVPYAVVISDDRGALVPQATIVHALETITNREAAPTDAAALSYLGSAVLASGLEPNDYPALVESLFAVHLSDVPDHDEDQFLQRITFTAGQAWAYKTMTYQICLASGRIGTHMEHSTVDGATLKNTIALAQQTAVVDLDAPGTASQVTSLDLEWNLDGIGREAVAARIAEYGRAAAEHRTRTVRVPLPISSAPIRLSADAVAQWLMLYAQLATYGRVRSTYEAVDMREYQAGRTECLRPNGAAAVALATALRDGDAHLAQIEAAGAEHKQWVKWCKTGQAIDRHLFGLRLMAQRHGLDTALWQEAGYARLTTDFLSTSSLGDPAQLMRFAFAPTSAGGLGISYHHEADVFEFCVNYREAEHGRDIEEFLANLAEGGQRVGSVLNPTA